jgi:hypothetical protein
MIDRQITPQGLDAQRAITDWMASFGVTLSTDKMYRMAQILSHPKQETRGGDMRKKGEAKCNR